MLAPLLTINCPYGSMLAHSARQASLFSHSCHIEKTKKTTSSENLEKIIPQFLKHMPNINPELITLARERGVMIILRR